MSVNYGVYNMYLYIFGKIKTNSMRRVWVEPACIGNHLPLIGENASAVGYGHTVFGKQ